MERCLTNSIIEYSKPILIIGCGSIGKRHIKNLLSLNACNLIAYDISDNCRSEVNKKFGVKTVDSLDEAFCLSPHIVMITTPSSRHISLAIQAAQHDCHLFIEKPLSDSLQKVDDLISIVKDKNLISLVGCNMRFHPGLMIIKDLIANGTIGKIVSAKVEFGHYLPNWHPWEDYRKGYSARIDLGGGVILDAIHEIDYIQWLFGDVESVFCFSENIKSLEIETESVAAILIRFSNGIIGEVHLDYIQRDYSRNCHIIGTEGTIKWDDVAGKVFLYKAKEEKWQTFKNPKGWDFNCMYIDEIRYFISCVQKNEKTTLDIKQSERILKTAIAAKKSNETEKIVKIK